MEKDGKAKCIVPVKTTRNKSELPGYAPEETLVIELWDLS
jgi:hypothetical protein